MTEKQKYYSLLALVCEDLPTGAVDSAVRGGHEATSVQLMAVRHGRMIQLAWLNDLIRVGLPGFQVPEHLLPTDSQPVGSPLFP